MTLEMFAGAVMLLVVQKVRASKHSNLWTYPLVALIAVGLFWFKDAAAGVAMFADKTWWQGLVIWAYVAATGGRVAEDVGLAPKTNHN